MKVNATRRMQSEAYLKKRKVCFKLHINASPEVGMNYKLRIPLHSATKIINEYFRFEIK